MRRHAAAPTATSPGTQIPDFTTLYELTRPTPVCVASLRMLADVTTDLTETEEVSGVPKSALAPGATLAAGLLWTVLAVRTPTNTFHFAPIIVAAMWPLIARGSVAPKPRRLWGISAAGTSIALAIGLGLWFTDHLRGPTLWHSGQAVTETVLFAVLGGMIGLVGQLRHR